MALTVLADDLTGACDTGVAFAGPGPVPVTVWPQAPADPARFRGAATPGVRVLDTETRHRPPGAAAARVRGAVAAAGPGRWFKKIDSTLRGPIGAEVEALLTGLGAPGAVVCPAFPRQGRVVVDRVLRVGGQPVRDTPVAEDPDFPRDAGTSSVVDLLRPQVARALAWVPLDHVRAGVDALAARLQRLAGTITVVDAETDDDLATLAAATLAVEPEPLLVGAAGLAHALAARLGLPVPAAGPPPGGRWLLVAGSRHPATVRQARVARQAGLAVIVPSDGADARPDVVAAALAAEAVERLARAPVDVLAVSGGDTAAALYAALDAERIDLAGALVPGVAFGHLRTPRHGSLALVTKAGGFGEPDLFVSLLREVVA